MISLRIPYEEEEKIFRVEERNLLYNFMPNLPPRPSRKMEEKTVINAVQNPAGSHKIQNLVDKGDKVVILVDDWTRPTPAYKIVPIILGELFRCGVKESDIKFIFACGTHEPLDQQQMMEKLGREILGKFSVQNHNPTRNLSYLGESSRGTPVLINKFFMEADFKIAVGSICAHPIAGYGGGTKIIVPGVAGEETIDYNHSMADSLEVAIGKTDGNLVREDMEEIAGMAGLNFIVNVILNPKREIIDVVAGDPIEAHREGVTRYNQIYGIRVGEEADIVVLGANPRDATLYHGTFALPCAVPFVKEGGTIIWVAPCLSGSYTRAERLEFRWVLSMPPHKLMRAIKSGEVPASGGIFDWCTSKVVHRNKVVLVSDNISKVEAEEFGFSYGESIQEVLDREFSRNKDAKVTVIPVGGLAVPIYR